MIDNTLKAKLEQGQKVVGTFFELGGTTAVECLGLSGLDFLIIDTEHGPFTEESAKDMIAAAELHGIAPLVRVRDSSRAAILRMLDIGARGLIIPNLQSLDEARQLVDHGKYFPLGRRGFAPTRVAGYGFDPQAQDINAYFALCNRQTLLLPQCETLGCLNQIEEIAALPGIDGIFVGPYDLSVALGKPACFDDEAFLSALARVLAACKQAGKYAMIYAGQGADARRHLAAGFDAVACGMDTIALIRALQALMAEIKADV